jgi:hypothetical protein
MCQRQGSSNAARPAQALIMLGSLMCSDDAGHCAEVCAARAGCRCFERQLPLCRLLRFYIHLLLDDDRECESKRRAPAELRLDPYFTAVHFDNTFRYGKPQASATLRMSAAFLRLAHPPPDGFQSRIKHKQNFRRYTGDK